MKYAHLGDSGLIVSRLGFGAMTFANDNRDPLFKGIYKVDEGLADRLIGMAIDAGINLFDTADAYAAGESERILGRLLKAHRQDVLISTKVGLRSGPAPAHAGLSRRHINWSVDQSLKRLGTDWIDLYVVHCEDSDTALEETLSALDGLVRAGKVRALGFSNWSAWKVAAAMEIQRACGFARFSHGQMHYSLLTRDIERDFVPAAEHYRLGLTVWGPLAGGFLTGKYAAGAASRPDDRRDTFDVLPFDTDIGFGVVEAMRSMAERHGCTIAQLAIAWLLARPITSSVLLGATKLPQLENTLAAIDVRLSDEDMSVLDSLTALPPSYPNWVIERQAHETRTALAGSSDDHANNP